MQSKNPIIESPTPRSTPGRRSVVPNSQNIMVQKIVQQDPNELLANIRISELEKDKNELALEIQQI